MYNISTICFGNKYTPIREHWEKKMKETCITSSGIYIWDQTNIKQNEIKSTEYAFWDGIRLKKNINLLLSDKKPVVHCDMDLIIEKDINSIVNLPYDFIISTEIGGNKSFPKECSEILGFGVCSGFYVIKEKSIGFLMKILKNMNERKFNSLSDQVNIMKYITNSAYNVYEDVVCLDNIQFKNKVIEIDDIKICVLDFEIIERDPILTKNQYGKHINIDNVGGVNDFIKYFYDKLENLPLTCRCGKPHLGDYNECNHIIMRSNNK
jgi:hypothetical protein